MKTGTPDALPQQLVAWAKHPGVRHRAVGGNRSMHAQVGTLEFECYARALLMSALCVSAMDFIMLLRVFSAF